MSRPNFIIPDNPIYDENIPALLDQDPASASLVFNPLFLRLIINIHALKQTTDVFRALLYAITGYEINNAVNTFSELPPAGGLSEGTFFLVMEDETRGGKSSVYKIVGGEWVFFGRVTEQGIDEHNQDPNAHENRFSEMQTQIDYLTKIVTGQRQGQILDRETGELLSGSLRDIETGEVQPLVLRDIKH
ncbi:MAG: hypothetical protein FWF78_00425 [Defluviitaleaceae bacterium]|nr:hypothetical protein [Defluviitaleaceae bacterium]